GSGRPTERTACRGAILPWWRCRAPDPLVSYIRVQFRTAQPRWELSKATVLHAKPGTALIDYKKTIVQNHAPQDAYQSEQRPGLCVAGTTTLGKVKPWITSSAKKGKQQQIQSESLLEFRLEQPVKLPVVG